MWNEGTLLTLDRNLGVEPSTFIYSKSEEDVVCASIGVPPQDSFEVLCGKWIHLLTWYANIRKIQKYQYHIETSKLALSLLVGREICLNILKGSILDEPKMHCLIVYVMFHVAFEDQLKKDVLDCMVALSHMCGTAMAQSSFIRIQKGREYLQTLHPWINIGKRQRIFKSIWRKAINPYIFDVR